MGRKPPTGTSPRLCPNDVPPVRPLQASLLERLLMELPAELIAEAYRLAAERLEMTPEKLALLIVHAVNPAEVLMEREEALLRGLYPKTLTSMKANGEVPRVLP